MGGKELEKIIFDVEKLCLGIVQDELDGFPELARDQLEGTYPHTMILRN